MALGVFDSGVGGLTVVKEIKKRWPERKIIYLGDTARVPYGPRGKDVVTEFAKQDVGFLLSKGVNEIVIACNTVSALAGEQLKKDYAIPIVDVIAPAVEAAKKITHNKKIGVIGTRGTIGSHAYLQVMSGYEVFEQACPLFVPFIEEGEWEGDLIENLAYRYLSFAREKQVDTLILGCTHYPVIEPVIRKTVGDGVQLVHCGKAVAERLADVRDDGEESYFFTDVHSKSLEIAEQILGEKIEINKASL